MRNLHDCGPARGHAGPKGAPHRALVPPRGRPARPYAERPSMRCSMAEHPHSKHSPPSARQGLATTRPGSFGNLYPQGDIVAVIDGRAEAESAARALADDGIPAGDVSLLAGDWVVELQTRFEAQR